MKHQLAILTLLFVLAATGNTEAQENAEAHQTGETSIRGTWKVISMIEDGKAQLVADSMELVILEQKLKLMEDNTAQFEMNYRLDMTTTPWQVDLSIGDSKLAGIYKIEDDTMSICISPGEARPTKFASVEGSEFTFLTVKRKQ